MEFVLASRHKQYFMKLIFGNSGKIHKIKFNKINAAKINCRKVSIVTQNSILGVLMSCTGLSVFYLWILECAYLPSFSAIYY